MTVRLPPGLKAQLAAFAERTGLSMNEIVCSAVAFATKG
jgi:predicted HicB family RNase H-like nuclease